MMQRNLLRLLLTLLVFSYILYASAIPPTRTLSLSAQDFSLAKGEGFNKRKMDLEMEEDYTDPGPNPDHDPKVPHPPPINP